jgi:hypothetical protein
MLAAGLDGGVEQLARNISPGSYLVCSVNMVGGECGNSVGKLAKSYILAHLCAENPISNNREIVFIGFG